MLKNNKAVGKDKINAELLKARGHIKNPRRLDPI